MMKRTIGKLLVLLIIAMFFLTACEETLTHVVTWEHEDGSVLKTENVIHGTMPNYTGQKPVKNPSGGNEYEFDGWTPELTEVTSDQTYTAMFKIKTTRTVTWMNYDGKVLKTDEVKKGDAPVHPYDLNPTPPTPTYRLEFDAGSASVPKEPVVVYQYKFKEWFSHNQNNNYRDQVFTATYDTYGPGSESHPDGELADLTDFTFESSSSNPYATNTGHFCHITGYTGTDIEDLYIPKFYNGELVVYVNVDFREDTHVNRLIIPDSVLNLATDFEKNVNLRRLVVSDNLRGITGNSFKDCTALYKIDIPEGVETSTYASEAYTPRKNDIFDNRIGYEAFAGCTSLVSVDVPDAMQEIGGFAFAGCTNLQIFKMPIFADPEDPENNTSNLKKIERGAFKGCKRLDNILIPDTVEEIGWESFFGCSSLKKINVPPKVKTIGPMTFMLCTSLRTITLSEGLETINSRAFEECRALKKLKIPKSVTSIIIYAEDVWEDRYWWPYVGEAAKHGGGILVGCESLDTLTVNEGNDVYEDKNKNVIYHVASDTLIAGCMSSKIPTGTKKIAKYAFDGHIGLEKDPGIENNPTLESIEHRAFWGCLDNGAVQMIDLHRNLTYIGPGAFQHEKRYIENPYTGEREMSNPTYLFSPYEDPYSDKFDYSGASGGGVGIRYYSPEWNDKYYYYHHWTDIWREEDNPALQDE